MTTTLRRSSLYVPGNNPSMLINAGIYGADVLVFDLEDAVPFAEKDAARTLLRNALSTLRYASAEVVVRINSLSTPFGREDLEMIIPRRPDAIRIPKCETARDVTDVDRAVGELEAASGIERGSIRFMPIIETALGAWNVMEIATACPRVTALNFGAEDYTADIGAIRTKDGTELADLRARMLLAARVAGVQALDSVYSDVADDDGLYEESRRARILGFDGKSVIHPRQIPVVHRAFTPSEKEIAAALRVERGLAEGKRMGVGVVVVDGKMVDAPVLKRARKVLELARAAGALPKEEESSCR